MGPSNILETNLNEDELLCECDEKCMKIGKDHSTFDLLIEVKIYEMIISKSHSNYYVVSALSNTS